MSRNCKLGNRKQRQVDSSVLVVAFNMLDDDELNLESEPKNVYAL